MKKEPKPWPVWKIAAVTAACAVVAAVLFWLLALVGKSGGVLATSPAGRGPVMTAATFIMMFAIIAAILALLGLIWLAYRIQEARRPVWERRGRKKRR